MSEPSDLSRSQIDKLGDRLRSGPVSADDISQLDRFKTAVTLRTSAFASRTSEIAARTSYPFTTRAQKTNPSIIDKLRRTSSELSRMQDIAACRFIVPTMKHHEDAWGEIVGEFPDARTVDRLGHPNNGYRAAHFILSDGFYSFEIQLRTELQHAWATLSEKLADRFGQGLKYGQGPEAQRAFLMDLSNEIALIELHESDEVMSYGGMDDADTDVLAAEGSPTGRQRRAILLRRISEMRRFL